MIEITETLEIAINGWFAGDQASGSGQYTNHLLRALPQVMADTGQPVRLSLLLPDTRAAEKQRLTAQWPEVDLVFAPLPRLPANLAKVWWEQVTVPTAVRRLNAHVLWVPYWAGPFWRPAPVVVTIHDLIPLLMPAYRGGMLQRLYTRLVCLTSRRATAIITVSEASARDVVAQLNIPAERVHPIPHGPNQENIDLPDAAGRAAVRSKYGLPERFFLYLGGYDVRKNVRSALQAYRRYLDRGGDPAVKFVLAGKLPAIDSAFFPDPRKTADELALGEQVVCCGWIDEADKPTVYALATAFIFPSLYEGFGMMVLEAMQAGTPVVTSGVR